MLGLSVFRTLCCAAVWAALCLMRLTKLKLAGFKSFVDPTTLGLPGQLVGVVGPNGCGKSNVIDAVRWVLGESKASELRGESMQDVIFNGSSTRKAVSRAAVEMVFDNSLGRISGQWSQYNELSVKRILTRNGQSEYYINNQHVRRKDITDLFLGTGLGPRAYAIIGQGTISRIIEARPDELRVFLEEAAGVTKYKERRKETETRLADTRDNLTRVEDIRTELSVQIERLEAQAAVARQYREYNDEMTRKQHLLWLSKKNEAQVERERLARDVERAINELEEKNAALSETQSRLEEIRENHFSANDGLHQAQSELFSVNAEAARLEAEIRHRRESQHEYESRLEQLKDDELHWQQEVEKYNGEEIRWNELREVADSRVEQGEMRLSAQQERLPQAEDAQHQAQEMVHGYLAGLAKVEQALQVELTHQTHAQRSLQIIAARRERLIQERNALPEPDVQEFEIKQEALVALREKIALLQEDLTDRQEQIPHLEQQRRQALVEVQQVQKEKTEAQARRNALEQLQKQVQGKGQFAQWLARYHLENRSPLWKYLRVDEGWEVAVEAILRERISALSVDEVNPAWQEDRPGSKLTLLFSAERQIDTDRRDGEQTLSAHVHCKDEKLASLVFFWLDGVLTAPDLAIALAKRERLLDRERYITPQGDMIARQSVTLFAPDASEHGLIERQREIERIGVLIEQHEARVEEEQMRLSGVEERLEEARNALQDARDALESLQEEAHTINVETLRLSQALDRFRERQAQIDASLGEMSGEEQAEHERLLSAQERIEENREQVQTARLALEDARSQLEQAERVLSDERSQISAVERELREAEFSQKECVNKLGEIMRNRDLARKQINRIVEELARCVETAQAMQAEDLEPRLQEALEQRMMKEQALAAMRDAFEALTSELRSLDELRLKHEHSLEPLRVRISDLKLKEQAAALNVEQLVSQLTEAGADEAALVAEVALARPAALQSAISALQRSIEALGAVNLAALEELESASQRKGFLDSQSEDLTQAMDTLENAIRRIDRETRDLLQKTFDEVNRNFGELFPILFGGGEAKLMMTGDEILDTGIQVMAQPPGKKNSTIQLLSGGEKALTAIALVFSLFRLNPAPFCLLDEVDAPLDDTNTERFCQMVRKMSENTQFLFVSHSKITMEMAQQLVGVTMQESGVSRIVEVDMEEALRMREQIV